MKTPPIASQSGTKVVVVVDVVVVVAGTVVVVVGAAVVVVVGMVVGTVATTLTAHITFLPPLASLTTLLPSVE